MEERVLGREAEGASEDLGDGEVILVAHATRGGKGVVDEGEMMKKERRGERVRSRGQGRGERIDAGRGESGEWLVNGDERGDFFIGVESGEGEEDIGNESLVNCRARRVREREQCTVFKVAVAPEIHCRGIAVILNKFARTQTDSREEVVVGRGGDERGAGGEKGHVKCPKILEGGADREEKLERD